jgi:coenzyme F420-reducing hydrogenase delta subunit
LEIHVFYCSNSFNPADFLKETHRLRGIKLRTTSLPCSGKVNLPYLLKAFEGGVDGAILATCPEGGCRQMEGYLRAQKRAQAVDELLRETGMGMGRIISYRMQKNATTGLVNEVINLSERIKNLPQQPAKETAFSVTGKPE